MALGCGLSTGASEMDGSVGEDLIINGQTTMDGRMDKQEMMDVVNRQERW